MYDKEEKMKILEEMMEEMDGRVGESLKPKSKMVIKAEGDDPEEMKEGIIDKLEGLELPSEEDMEEMSEGMESEESEEEMSEGMEEDEEEMEEEDYMSELPQRMKEKLMEAKKKKRKEEY